MPDPILAEINLTTYEEIYPRVVEDQYFKATPFQMHLRERALVPFGGGSRMQNTFLARPMIGGAYAVGDNFNIQKIQTLAGTAFDPKYYEVSVPEYKEIIMVLNTGNLAVFDLIELDLQNAMNTISAIIAIDLSLHGQPAGGGVVGNRPKNLNGWIEAVNDGITPGWDGSIFTAYGTQARNGFVLDTMNSVPVFGGNLDGSSAPIQYPFVEELYQTASVGNQEPDLIVSNKALYASVKERIQPQQRFAQERDPYWGVNGMRINSAIFLKDDYFPSTKYGKNDQFLGNYLAGTFVSPGVIGGAGGGTADTRSNLPVINTVVTVGEVLGMFNMSKWLFRISNSEEFGFGFSGFIPAQDNTRVVGQVKAAVNLEGLSPRMQAQAYGLR